MNDIEIVANGQPHRVPEGSTIESLMAALELPPGRVAVEHNGKLIPRRSYGEVALAAGDRLEIVTLVGGG